MTDAVRPPHITSRGLSALESERGAGQPGNDQFFTRANDARRDGSADIEIRECYVPLKFRVARRAREGDHVANIRDAGDEHEHALEAEAETGVRHGAVAAQIEIPL